jgi:O-antigen/teichoic acid export membrane protein
MSLSRSIFRHTAIYSAATLLGKLSGFLLLPFYAHIFQTEGYGIIAMLDTSLGFLTVLLSGGMQAAILRIYHEQPVEAKPAVLGAGVYLVWALAIGLVTLPMIFAESLSELILGKSSYSMLICLALLAFVADVTGQSASTFLVIKEKSILYSLIGLARMFLGIGLNIWLVLILKLGLDGVFIASLITAVLGSLALHGVAIHDHGLKYDRQIAWQILRFQLPQLPGYIVSFAGRQAERVLVRVQLGLDSVGILEMAYKFPPLLNLIIAIPFQRAWRTKSFEIAEDPQAPVIMGQMLTRYVYLMTFAGLVLAVAVPKIIELVTPAEFWPAAHISRIEIATVMLSAFTTFMTFGILYSKQTKLLSYLTFALTPLKILLAYVMITMMGLAGAAYSALIIGGLGLIWTSRISQRLYPIVIETRRLFLITAVAGVMFWWLESQTYHDNVAADVLRHNLMPPLANLIRASGLDAAKSARIITLITARQEAFIILVFNVALSFAYLLLMPLLWRRTPRVAPD